MKKIFFCCLLMGCASLLKAQTVPPQRTTDAVRANSVQNVSLPIKNGGGAPVMAGKTQALPLRSSDGNSGGSQGQGLLHPGSTGNAANTKALRPSDLAVKQDSLQKH